MFLVLQPEMYVTFKIRLYLYDQIQEAFHNAEKKSH